MGRTRAGGASPRADLRGEAGFGSLTTVDDGLVARCTGCGAPQPVMLLPKVERCRHCGAADPLPSDVRARVREVARTIARQRARTLAPEVAARAGDLGWMAVALVGGSLLVGGGLTLVWIVGDLPSEASLAGLFFHGTAPGLDPADTTAFWWMLFAFTCIVASAAVWVWGGQLAVWLLIRDLRAHPSLEVGGPARCHLCGDALPPEGLVRSCRSCKAHNLVDGVHFRRAAANLQAAISDAERAADDRVAARVETIRDGVLWAAGMPFVLLIVMPLSLVLDGPHPGLLGVPLALAAIAVLLRGVGAWVRPVARRVRGPLTSTPHSPRSAGPPSRA
ncbi:MAG: hypothetical protein U0169_08430 [Polyangiaceae bacterium]